MINRTFSSVAVIVALGILMPMQLHAFGLGKLELSSALNEPFKATIPVTALREDEEGNLQVRLATENEFARAGIERSFYLTNLVFTVVEHPGGATIEVSSQQPIREPFVNFLLTATTGEGLLIREYIVLLDPPKSMFLEAPSRLVTPTQENIPSQQIAEKTTYQQPSTDQPEQTTSYYSGNSYRPTKRNDTLWEIALATKPSSAVSVHQMMLALLDANPNAFMRNNINNLKTGFTLTIPSIDDITKLSNRQAVARVGEQYQQWKAANNIVAVVADEMEPIISENNIDIPQGEELLDTAAGDARLQLVVDSDDATIGADELSPLGSDSLAKLRDQLTLAQETIEGQQQENIDFKARMDAMEDQLEIMRRIIMVKDSDLARLQDMLGDDQQLELESDTLSEEMQTALDESNTDELVGDTEALRDDTTADIGMDDLVDDAAEMLDTAADELVGDTEALRDDTTADIGMDGLVDDAAEMLDTAADELIDGTEALLNDADRDGLVDGAEQLFDGAYIAPSMDELVDDVDEILTTYVDELVDSTEQLMEETTVDSGMDELSGETDITPQLESQTTDEVAAYFAVKARGEDYNPNDSNVEEVLPYPELTPTEETVTNQAAQLGLVDKIKAFIADNTMVVWGGLAALLLALLALLRARRRKQDEYEWVDTESLDASVNDTELTNKATDNSATAAPENIVDNEQVEIADETETVEIRDDAETVETIDELLNQAEMSIVYGEYEEAHAAVEKARIKQPASQAVALKLVALAYHQQQPEEFTRLAADINLDKDSSEWQEIAGWGRALVPENELFAEEGIAALSADLVDTLSTTDNDVELDPLVIDEENTTDAVMEFSLDESVEDLVEDEQSLSFDTDFDLENTSNKEEGSLELDTPLTVDNDSAADDDIDLVLDLDMPDVAEVLTDEATDVSELVEEIELEELDVSSDEELPELVSETNVEALDELDVGNDDLDFDIGDFDEVDEAETKLDLAAAYVDMGDPDGAKNILTEVLQEGNEDQQSRAQKLLNNLAS